MGANTGESAGTTTTGRKVREYRSAMGLSQEALAELTGLGVRTIRDIEAGRARPRLSSLKLLVDALELDAAGFAALADSGPKPTVPHQLPPGTAVFTGRDDAVESLVRASERAAETLTTIVVHGMAGVGKTALVVRAARELTARFPDGELFIDLHGFSGEVPPVRVADALDRLLLTLGVPAERIPADIEDRTALYRAELRDRRMLIVLDNAADELQVEALLPAEPGHLVLVTSRRLLAGLDEAEALPLDVLPPSEAAELFTTMTGVDPVADGEAVAAIAECCGGLPLALRVAAARLRSRPQWTAAALLARLREGKALLTELEVGHRSVRTALGLSYGELDEDHRHLFRALALAPGGDTGPYAAAALGRTGLRDTRVRLEDLVDMHLLDTDASGRYSFHDLTRRFAAETAEREFSPAERSAIRERVLDLYWRTTRLVASRLWPHIASAAPGLTETDLELPPIGGVGQALGWFRAERANIFAAVDLGVRHGVDEPAWQLASAVAAFGEYDTAPADYIDALETCLAAARRHGRADAEGLLLGKLAGAYRDNAEYDKVVDCLQQALEIHRAEGNTRRQAATLNNLGVIARQRGHFPEAVDAYHEALGLAMGGPDGEHAAFIRGELSMALAPLRRHDEALELLRRVGERLDTVADEAGLARMRTYLGVVQRGLGNPVEAMRLHWLAAEYYEKSDSAYLAAGAANEIGVDLRELGRHADAIAHHGKALDLIDGVTDPWLESVIRNELGRSQAACGLTAESADSHRRALKLAVAAGADYEAARARHGLADAARADGDLGGERDLLGSAAETYAVCGVPEAAELRDRLAGGS